MVENHPTTENGPLHDPAVDLNDRKIVATYASAAEGQAVADQLIAAGIAAERVTLTDAAADPEVAAATAPAENSIVGAIRHALAPIEHHATLQDAARNGQSVLTVTPLASETEAVVQMIEASNPAHFDAALERWRNA